MINLLPPELKASYRYAQRNVLLVRWVVAFAFGLVGLAGISTAGIIYVHQTALTYTAQIATLRTSLQQQQLSATEAEVTSIGNDLKLAVQVLSKEVLFSKLLAQLATVTPTNAVLTDLSISKVQGAVSLTAMTTDYATATQLQVNLNDPNNQIFSHADIMSITCTPGGTDPLHAHYPCTVSIRALFATNNPFLFINAKGNG